MRLYDNTKVALIYDRVNKWGGAERTLQVFFEMFPNATLYTSLYDKKVAIWARRFVKVTPSRLNSFPALRNKHQYLGVLMPLVFESHALDRYDLVISVTSESAKGVITSPDTLHICYCLTPTRYLWSHYDTYFSSKILKSISNPAVKYLKRWEAVASQRPDEIVAISSAVQKRILDYYGRQSRVIHPPLSLEKVANKRTKDSFYLLVGRLVGYKKAEIVVKAFNILNEPLVVVGKGSEESSLKRIASGNITFKKDLSDTQLSELYLSAKALIFPQEEDFGLVAIESISHGTPVIAYGRGGILDIITDKRSGILFDDQSVEGVVSAVKHFQRLAFDSTIVSQDAKKFSKNRFKEKFFKLIKEL